MTTVKPHRAVHLVPHPLQVMPTFARASRWRELSDWPVVLSVTPAAIDMPPASADEYARLTARRLRACPGWTAEILAGQCVASLTAATLAGGLADAPEIGELVLISPPAPGPSLPLSHFLRLYPGCTPSAFSSLFQLAHEVDEAETRGSQWAADDILAFIWPEFERAAVRLFGERLAESTRNDADRLRLVLRGTLELERAYLRCSLLVRHYHPAAIRVPITLIFARADLESDASDHDDTISRWSEVSATAARILRWEGPSDDGWELCALDALAQEPGSGTMNDFLTKL